VGEDPTGWGRRDPPAGARFHCSFCGKYDAEVDVLVAGDQVWICSNCVALCAQIVEVHQSHPDPDEAPALAPREATGWVQIDLPGTPEAGETTPMICAFCERIVESGGVGGPTPAVRICDDCILLVLEMRREELGPDWPSPST
jgi:hypothetical protein